MILRQKIIGLNSTEMLHRLYPVRSDHAEVVIKNALMIANEIGYSDKNKVETAALLHDVMKAQARAYMKSQGQEKALIPLLEEHRAFYQAHGIFIDEGKHGHTSNRWITHAPESAYYAFHTLGITDDEILWAIAHHQTGRHVNDYDKMTTLEKIIFLADYIDIQESDYEKHALEILQSQKNIDLALAIVLNGTVKKEYSRTDKPGGPTLNENLVAISNILTTRFCLPS